MVSLANDCSLDSGGLGAVECGYCGFERLFHRDDAIEAGGVQEPDEGCAVAEDDDEAVVLPDAADAADQRAETGRVHERNTAQVHNQPPGGGVVGERLTELRHRVGV